MMRTWLATALFALVALACTPPPGATTATTTTPVAEFTPTAFSVKVLGTGRPIIFVPGLGSPGSVWDDTVSRLGGKYQTHVLTLAGFAGQPPSAGTGPLLDTARKELALYIRGRHLDHPIVVGHSLGGFLVMWLAATEPNMVGGVVVVDASPDLIALSDDKATQEEITTEAGKMRDQIASQTPEQFKAGMKMFFKTMVTDPVKLEALMDEVAKSDQKTMGNAFYEMLTTDLRPLINQILVPTLFILADSEYAHGIEGQTAPIKDHTVSIVPHTKHFVMIDDPVAFNAVLTTFLAHVGH